MDCSPPGSSVQGILQARILEWVAIALLQGSFPNQGSNPHLSHLLHWQAGPLPLATPGKPRAVQDYRTHVKVKVVQPCPALCDPMDYTVHAILQARILEWVAFPFSRGSSQAEPQGNLKNTGVSRLSLFLRIFQTQESNQGLLHCRQILYQLSYQGSPSQYGKVNYIPIY